MSKVGGGGGSVFMKFIIYIHSEILHSSFDPLTSKFWGGSAPPYQKVRGLKPPLPPRFSASDLSGGQMIHFYHNFGTLVVSNELKGKVVKNRAMHQNTSIQHPWS